MVEKEEPMIYKKIKHFTDLIVWQKSHQLVLDIYKITSGFPNEEKFGLVSQMRRAAYSIPANIAEGFKRQGAKDKIRFYNITQGSLSEVSSFLILATDLNYTKANFRGSVEEIEKLLAGLIRSIKTS